MVVAQGTALCLYVRREIRSLTSTDLDTYINTLYTLYTTPNEVGKELYGADFENSSYILRHHYFNAAQHDNDHIHEGNGFLMQHVKIANVVDQSLLLIDPRESLPYWDYTLDAVQNGLRHDLSPVLQTKTFGESLFLSAVPSKFHSVII